MKIAISLYGVDTIGFLCTKLFGADVITVNKFTFLKTKIFNHYNALQAR